MIRSLAGHIYGYLSIVDILAVTVSHHLSLSNLLAVVIHQNCHTLYRYNLNSIMSNCSPTKSITIFWQQTPRVPLMQYLYGSVHFSGTTTAALTGHTCWWLGQPARGHSVADAGRVGHHVWDEILLKHSSKQVRPGAQCKDANIISTVSL